MNTLNKRHPLLLATAAAALFTSGAVLAAEPMAAKEAKVHCGGVTACKGQSDCKTVDNKCKGQNTCKGKGFKSMSAKECAAAGGKVL